MSEEFGEFYIFDSEIEMNNFTECRSTLLS